MIYEKILTLLEKKITFYKDPSNLLARSLTTKEKSDEKDINIVYPPLQMNLKKSQESHHVGHSVPTNSDFTKASLSVRDFLVLGMEALILSCNDHDKIPLSLELLNKNFQFLKKIIFDSQDDEWMVIFKQIIKKLHILIQDLKEKMPGSVNLVKLIEFFVKFINNFTTDSLRKFISQNTNITTIIKDIIFFSATTNEINKLLDKIKAIQEVEEQGGELADSLTELVEDYEKAEIIRKSIKISKSLSETYVKLDTSNKSDYDYLMQNFSNIIISSNFVTNNIEIPYVKILLDLWEIARQNNFLDDFEELCENFKKILSICDKEAKMKIISDLQYELKSRNYLQELIEYQPENILLILNEMSGDSFSMEAEITDLIVEIVNKTLNSKQNTNLKINLANLIQIMPNSPKNFKLSSLNIKLESISIKEKLLKYIKLLFSKNELVRLNAVNYFRSHFVKIGSKILEFVNLSNMEQIKKLDSIYIIQSAETEFNSLLQNIDNNSLRQADLDSTQLLNIIFSSKMETNIKRSALEQLVFLVKTRQNLFNKEVFDLLTNEFISIFYNNSNYDFNNLSALDFNYCSKISNDVLLYMGSLLKLINLIIYFYINQDFIVNFLKVDESLQNSEVFAFITACVPLIFSKHGLSVQAIIFLDFITFSDINLSKLIKCNLKESDHLFKLPKIYENNYFTIIPSSYIDFNNI